MNCPHSNNHCHECEKAKIRDGFIAFGLVVATILAFWFFGWGVWKFVLWPWLFLAVLWLAKYFIDKSEKDKNQNK